MTVAELIDLLRKQDPMLEVKVIVRDDATPSGTKNTRDVIHAYTCIPGTGRRRVEIVTTE